MKRGAHPLAMPSVSNMVPILLFLILLVIAWPIFAVFGGTLFVVLGSNLHIIVPTVLIALAYIAFLAPIAKRNNIKLGGKIGEPLDPLKPMGPEFRTIGQENGGHPRVTAGFFNTPDQWKRVAREPNHQQPQTSAKGSALTAKRAIGIAALAIVIVAPLTVVLIDQGVNFTRANGLLETNPNSNQAAQQANAPLGRWLTGSSTDPMTDRKTVSFVLEADQRAVAGLPITLIVACSGRVTSVGINWRDYLGAETTGEFLIKEITLRLGNDAPTKKTWVTDAEQTSTWAGQPTRNLVAGLIANDKFAAEVTPYNSSPVVVTFSTAGLKSLMDANAAQCG